MTEQTNTTELRDAVFQHEMFVAGNIKSGYLLESICYVEATWGFDIAEISAELGRMEAEGLVLRGEGFGGDVREYWSVTTAGAIAREKRWQERGLRHPALASGNGLVEDMVMAVIASGGGECEEQGGEGLAATALNVYLFRLGDTVRDSTLNALISRRLVRRDDEDLLNWPFRLVLTAEVRRLYALEVVPRLGLRSPMTVLAPTGPERLPFDDLDLEPTLADNLRYRWEEAERCEAARAWLAATTLYGSILEVILPDWLGRDVERAKAAKSAPAGKQGQVPPLGSWTLSALINVAVELGELDQSLGRHADALRESRNLIHPDRQLRERSTPDGDVAAISKRVVRAVLDALARATQVGAR